MSYRKDAVNIGVTLSTQLIAAALAMIAVVGTFTAFVIDKKSVDYLYYVITISSFLSFIISIVCGGKGIDKARQNGFNNIWNLIDTKSFFNNQAIFCFLGILFFMISVFLGTEKKDNSYEKIEVMEKKIIKLEIHDSINQTNLMLNTQKIETLNFKVDSLERLFSKRKIKRINIKTECCKTIIQNFDSITTLNNNIR